MCFELDSLPPIPVVARRRGLARGSRARGGRRQPLRRLRRDARASRRRTGVVVLPDVRGLYRFYEELALRFAERGYAAIAIDYFGRTAGVGKRDDDFPYTEHVAQTTQEGIQADVARRRRRGSASGRRRGGLHGRLLLRRPNSWLAAAGGHGLAGAVGFYGGPGERNGRPGPTQLAAEIDGADPRAAGRRRREHHAGAERRLRRGALSRGRRARARRLRRRAAQLLRPPLRGARRGLGRRLAACARVHRATRCLSRVSCGAAWRLADGSRMISAPPVSIGWYSYVEDVLQRQLVDRRRLGQILGVGQRRRLRAGASSSIGCLSCSLSASFSRKSTSTSSSSGRAA